MNKDIKVLIFRKQIVYFIVLLILEIPYAVMICSFKYFTLRGYYTFMQRYAEFYNVATATYISRGIFLSLLTLTEP